MKIIDYDNCSYEVEAEEYMNSTSKFCSIIENLINEDIYNNKDRYMSQIVDYDKYGEIIDCYDGYDDYNIKECILEILNLGASIDENVLSEDDIELCYEEYAEIIGWNYTYENTIESVYKELDSIEINWNPVLKWSKVYIVTESENKQLIGALFWGTSGKLITYYDIKDVLFEF